MNYDNSTLIIKNLARTYRNGNRNETICIIETLYNEKILDTLDICVFLEYCGYETYEIDTIFEIYDTTNDVLHSLYVE